MLFVIDPEVGVRLEVLNIPFPRKLNFTAKITKLFFNWSKNIVCDKVLNVGVFWQA